MCPKKRRAFRQNILGWDLKDQQQALEKLKGGFPQVAGTGKADTGGYLEYVQGLGLIQY